MHRNSKSTTSLQCFHNRKALLLVSLLFIITLTSSCLLSEFNNSVSPFASGASDKGVNNETELRDAINNAPNKRQFIIALNNDITLTEPLKIPINKNITLTSNKATGFYKLIGATDQVTITVEEGELVLDGVIVTHANGDKGRSVEIFYLCTLVMYGGEISNNINGGNGGGVINHGTFTMFGGVITNNTAYFQYDMWGREGFPSDGGGIYNAGIFTMHGGQISNNNATGYGGGVYNYCVVFERFGGVISANTSGKGGNDVYPEDSDSSGGDSGSSNGNGGLGSGGNGGLGSGGNGGSSNGNGGSSNGNGGISEGDGYSLKDVIIVCVGVVGLAVGVVAVGLFFYFGRRMKQVEAKFNTLSQDKGEE
jgi:hypothetical protein